MSCHTSITLIIDPYLSKPNAFIWHFINARTLKRPHISSYFHTKPIFMLRTDPSCWAGNTINTFILQGKNSSKWSDGALIGCSESEQNYSVYHPELFQSISISGISALSRLGGCDNWITDIFAGLFMHSVSRINSQVPMEESPQRFASRGSKSFKNCRYQLQTVLFIDIHRMYIMVTGTLLCIPLFSFFTNFPACLSILSFSSELTD